MAMPPAPVIAATQSSSVAHSCLTEQDLPSPRYLVNACCLFLTWPSRMRNSAMWVRLAISLLAANASAPSYAPVMPFFSSLAAMASNRFRRPLRTSASRFCRVSLCSSKSKPTTWMVRPRQVTDISTPLTKERPRMSASARASASPPVWSWSVRASRVQPF